jgi:hypothetical protein
MYFRWTVLTVVGALVFGASYGASAQNRTGPKKLIEWGWDEPDTKFMRQNVAKMEQLPFDGLIFHVAGSRGGNLSW